MDRCTVTVTIKLNRGIRFDVSESKSIAVAGEIYRAVSGRDHITDEEVEKRLATPGNPIVIGSDVFAVSICHPEEVR